MRGILISTLIQAYMSVLMRGILISTLIQAYMSVLMRGILDKHANTSIYDYMSVLINNSQIYWEKFKEIRNKVNSELTKAKTAFFCNKFENCAQSKDMKHSWKLINILLGKNKKSNNISQLKCDDVVILDDTLKAEAFNDFFVNIGVNLANEIENDSLCTNFSDDENYHSNYYSNINFKFSEISMDDIICQLGHIK